MEVLVMAGIIALAFGCEYLDSTLGMGYGTILSPLLIILGMDPLLLVPSILISQALGGLVAAAFHHRFENVDLCWRSRDTRIAAVLVVAGVLATVVGVYVAVSLPKEALKTYIGVLVIVMGTLMLTCPALRFTWRKMMFLGVLSAFNKAVTGGGFGPVVTSGQIISGVETRASIGITTAAEAPICIVSFLLYILLEGPIEVELPLLMTLGAVAAAPLGARGTRLRDTGRTLKLVGVLTIGLGIFTLLKTYVWT
jgi:uncharacterized membrane protein YfcA